MTVMSSQPLAAVLTLGCKLNLADSESIASGLRDRGFAVVDRLCEADAYVVNTCSVTHVADRKARRLIRCVRRLAPQAVVTVAGCYPRTAPPGEVARLGADFVAGTGEAERAAVVAFLDGRFHARQPGVAPAPGPGLRTRAFIRVQEGCNDVCAFCIVPRTRGRERSRPAAEVVAEVRAAVSLGVREVVLTGTQLGAWGRDFVAPERPASLIAEVLAGTDVPRLRFSSLQPQDITPELLALWEDPRVMPHFHLALQSGSDRTLARMRRRYTAREFLDAAARIRAVAPDAAITTDIIAGFPGETTADVDETLTLAREVGFARIHAFPYSPRQGTSAAFLPERVAPAVLAERMARLLALGSEQSAAFASRFNGSTRPVLWERPRSPGAGLPERPHGHTDNYISAYASDDAGAAELHNRITPVVLGAPLGDGLAAWRNR